MNQIQDFFQKSLDKNNIENELYSTYSVKKGLRNEDGTGVLVGLTKISDVVGYKKVDDKKVDDYGKLFYRGIDVKDIIDNHQGSYLFEEVCFLILFGYLPNEEEFTAFKRLLSENYELPEGYLQHTIIDSPAKNMMNKLQRGILMLYSHDDDPDNIEVSATLEKGLSIVAKIPAIMCYSYHTKKHFFKNDSLIIHHVNKTYSFAQQILYLLRPDGQFSDKEAEVLDVCLVLHADHGGGNNSTFTSVVISSTGTDLYSSIAGSIGSLKGPRHGGANLAVKKQMNQVIQDIGIYASDNDIRNIITRILDKDYNDKSGLIYGIGHAVYTLSDPRSDILAMKCKELAIEKGREDEYEFYVRFASIAIEEIYLRKGRNVCTNVDFYSGLVYDMLNIPSDLYTALFVAGRTVGWISHIIENKMYSNRIIRPATKYVGDIDEYKEIEER